MIEFLARLLLGLPPVVVFLLCLIWLDSFKLVGLRVVGGFLAWGAVAAGASFVVNVFAMDRLPLEPAHFSRYVAPIVEELLKAAALVVYLRRGRIGFLVDAAILGFATGAGFALVENLHYLQALPDARPVVWVVRGFGTAFMHGGTTAILGVLAKTLQERKTLPGDAMFLPGLGAAIVLHSFFNHFFFSPLVSTFVILVALPPVFVLVFQRSESSLRSWLGVGFDADAELLELIGSGRFTESRIGRYLQSLTERFPGPVVVDMLCYLRLHTELTIRAKGELMLREHGFTTKIEPEIAAKFEELRFLERSIGRTGRLAMVPFLQGEGKMLWQLYMLGGKK